MSWLLGPPPLSLRRLSPAGFVPLTLLLILSAASTVWAQIPDNVFRWQRWEKELTASVSLGPNPYKDVVVRVQFTKMGGTTFTQDAFWQADLTNAATQRRFKVRAALPEGQWTWQVISCTGNSGCSSVNWTPAGGTINVTRPATNTGIKLYDKGHPMQLTNITALGTTKSSLLYANDYSRFFWAADTAWTAPPREISGQTAFWSSYLTSRKNRQFSTVLIAPSVAWQPGGGDPWPALPGADGFSFIQSGNCGTNAIPNNCSKPRREYWDAFDAMVQQANGKDLLTAIIGVMDPVTVTNGNTGFPNVENARDFARYLTARMAGNAVVFSPGFDHAANKTTSEGTPLRQVMDEVGDAIKTASGFRRLVTAHLAGSSSCADYADFRDDGWMTFYFFQSGHGFGSGGLPPCPGKQSNETPTRAAIRRAREMPLHLATYTDVRLPSLNGEGPYDDYPATADPQNPYRLRQAGYLSTLSNATGYTYGVTRIWQWYGALSPFFSIPSVNHMQVMYNRFRNRPGLTARHAWILDQTADPNHENKKALAGTTTFAMAYVPQTPDRIKIRTSSLPGLNCGATWTKKWFPATSAQVHTSPITCTPGTGNITIIKPGCSGHPDCDYVLQLEKTGSGLAVPGGTSSTLDVVVWEELDPDIGTSAVYASRVNPDGTEHPPVVVSPAGSAFQNAPRVARAGQGYWVVWQAEDVDRSLLGVFGQRLKDDGLPSGPVVQLNTYTTDDQSDPAVASNAEGKTFFVWSSFGQDGDLGGVFARIFDSAGDPLAPEFQLHDDGTGFQAMPQVVTSYTGDFVVGWESDESLDSLGNALVLRAFRGTGSPATVEIRIGGGETEVLHLVDVQADITGGFTVRWIQDGPTEEVFTEWLQSFASDGSALAPPQELL